MARNASALQSRWTNEDMIRGWVAERTASEEFDWFENDGRKWFDAGNEGFEFGCKEMIEGQTERGSSGSSLSERR